MLDASSRIPSGISRGNFYSMGNYDVCLDIQTVETQFCRVSVNLATGEPTYFDIAKRDVGAIAQKSGSPLDAIGLYLCVFKSCSEQDLNIIFKGLLNFQTKNCWSKDSQPQLDDLAILAM